VTPWRRFGAVASLCIGLLTAHLAAAHEAAMGVIEFREVRPGAYLGRWQKEPVIGGERVRFSVPRHCVIKMPQLYCGSQGLVGPFGIDNLGIDMSAVLVRVTPLDGVTKSYTLTTATPTTTIVAAGAPTWATWFELAKTYVTYGIDHILLGVDHLLFVLGLVWLVRGGWSLVKTITAFTIGHSLSLAAAAFGLIGIPERPLNACIALSIVLVGVEIVREREGRPGISAQYPWAVAGGFGLVHGIGFATALVGLGLERAMLPAALLFFNVGVEIGQFAFVILVLLLMAAQRRLGAALPGRVGQLAPAYIIGIVASFWFAGRLAKLLVSP
jgi:HupE / UreJ protein